MKQDITREQFIEEMLKAGATNVQAEQLLFLSDTREGFPFLRELLANLVRQGQYVSAVGLSADEGAVNVTEASRLLRGKVFSINDILD